ncbi:hypothetical protein V8E55_004050 [Tylopilus felleus]
MADDNIEIQRVGVRQCGDSVFWASGVRSLPCLPWTPKVTLTQPPEMGASEDACWLSKSCPKKKIEPDFVEVFIWIFLVIAGSDPGTHWQRGIIRPGTPQSILAIPDGTAYEPIACELLLITPKVLCTSFFCQPTVFLASRRGKGLGGSFGINRLLWNMPARAYLDVFEESGNGGWNWASFAKCSKKKREIGPIVTSFPLFMSNLEWPVLQAMHNIGIKSVTTRICNSPFLREKHTLIHWRRLALAPWTLLTIFGRKWSRRGTKTEMLVATGVKRLHGKEIYEVKTSKNVCLSLSAGSSVASIPLRAELSSIGDREVLTRAGIQVKHELPGVGNNVWFVLAKRRQSPWLQIPDNGFPLQICRGLRAKYAVQITTAFMSMVPRKAKLHEELKNDINANQLSEGLRKQYDLQLHHLKNQASSLEIIVAPYPFYVPPSPVSTRYMSTLLTQLEIQ